MPVYHDTGETEGAVARADLGQSRRGMRAARFGMLAGACLAAAALAGCDAEGNLTQPRMQPDSCGASPFRSAIGQPYAATPKPAGVEIRSIRPGMMVTADFRDDRLNFRLDGAGVVTDVYCG